MTNLSKEIFKNTLVQPVVDFFRAREGVFVFIYFAWLSVRLILNRAYISQDYNTHVDHIKAILAGERWPWDAVDAPLFYYVAAPFVKVLGYQYGIPAFSFFVAFCVLAVVLLLYKRFSLIIAKADSQLAILFLLSLPVLTTTMAAFAADGFVLLPFFLLATLCFELLKTTDEKIQSRLIAGIFATQVLGLLIKYSFVSFAPAILLIGLVFLVKKKILSWGQKSCVILAIVIPALLHLAINTDYRNLAFGEMTPSAARTGSNQFFSQLSVFFSAYFSIAIVIFNIQFLLLNLKEFRAFLGNRNQALSDRQIFFITFWVPALAWFTLIIGAMPFVANPVYYWGYWTPRLILPSILVFGVIVFWAMGDMPPRMKSFFTCLVYLLIFLYINIVLR